VTCVSTSDKEGATFNSRQSDDQERVDRQMKMTAVFVETGCRQSVWTTVGTTKHRHGETDKSAWRSVSISRRHAKNCCKGDTSFQWKISHLAGFCGPWTDLVKFGMFTFLNYFVHKPTIYMYTVRIALFVYVVDIITGFIYIVYLFPQRSLCDYKVKKFSFNSIIY